MTDHAQHAPALAAMRVDTKGLVLLLARFFLSSEFMT